MNGPGADMVCLLAEAAAKLPCSAVMIDDEIIVQDENGLFDFEALTRLRRSERPGGNGCQHWRSSSRRCEG